MNVMIRCGCMLGFVALLAGCAPQENAASSARPIETNHTSFNATGAPTVAFHVPDMMCAEGCGTKVQEVLSEQPGAKEVLVDFDTKSASVAIEQDKFDAEAAIASLVDHGFDNSSLVANTSTNANAAPESTTAE